MINRKFLILLLLGPLLMVRPNYGKTNLTKPLFVATIPKSGTNLLSKLIVKMTGKRAGVAKKQTLVNQQEIDSLNGNNFYNTHAVCSDFNYDTILRNELKMILLIRDPRSVLVSLAHWNKNHPATRDQFKNYSIQELISELIKNYNCRTPRRTPFTIADFFETYLAWQKYPFLLTVRFEDIVGSKGGGDAMVQEQSFQDIARFLDIPLSHNEVVQIRQDIFGNSPTFRSGRLDSWKEELSREQKDALKPLIGNILIKLGYEKDLSW